VAPEAEDYGLVDFPVGVEDSVDFPVEEEDSVEEDLQEAGKKYC
jgi:hypothetical protein